MQILVINCRSVVRAKPAAAGERDQRDAVAAPGRIPRHLRPRPRTPAQGQTPFRYDIREGLDGQKKRVLKKFMHA